MRGFIHESEGKAFTESRLKARNGLACPPDTVTGYSFTLTHGWRVAKNVASFQYYQWNTSAHRYCNGAEIAPPSVPGASQVLASYPFGVLVNRYVYGISGNVATSSGALPNPNFKSRGRWKVVFTFTAYHTKAEDPVNPARHWVFFNLIRFAKDKLFGTPNTSHVALIRNNGSGGGVVVGGTNSDGVPVDAVPTAASDPAAVNSTWKFDMAAIAATPGSPYIFTDTIIVPETREFCRVSFDLQDYDFITAMQRLSNDGIVYPPPGADPSPDPPFSVGNDWGFLGSPITQELGTPSPNPATIPDSAADIQPGEYDLPLPDWLAGGAVDYNPGPPDGWDGEGGVFRLWVANVVVTRIPPLIPLFTHSVNVYLASFSYIAGLTNDGATTWDWDFGDGSPHANVQNPSHNYPGAGTYTVRLVVGNAYGDSAGHEASITLPIIAKFAFTPGQYPTAQFTNQSTGAATFDWNFGDGSPHSTSASPSHTFPAGPGSYTVTLTVGDAFGHTSVATHTVNIAAPMTVDFSSASQPSPPHTVQFNNLSIGPVATFGWVGQGFPNPHPPPTFFGGFSSTQTSPLVTFSQGGIMNVSLTATDIYGFFKSVTRGVSIP